MGVLVSSNEPRSSNGSDYYWDFTIRDDFTSGSIGDQTTGSIKCRIFRQKNKFPKFSGVGDIVILRKAKVVSWKERFECVSHKTTGVMVFPGSKIPTPSYSQSFQCGTQKLMYDSATSCQAPTIPEQMAVINMKAAFTSVPQQLLQLATIDASKPKATREQCLVKDLQLNKFYDICVQIVNVYYHPGGGPVDLKVTDYTPNEHMNYFLDPDEGKSFGITDNGFKGPFGFLTLGVTLYEANASWAKENVADGDYVYIRNMHVKLSRAGKLEGAVHQDQERLNQVDISHLEAASKIKDISKRRDEYEKKRGGKTAFEVMQPTANGPKEKMSKQQKKQAKKEKKRAEDEAQQRELEENSRQWEDKKSKINKNIKAAFPDMKLSTISEILYSSHLNMRTPTKYNSYTLPFMNCRHRSRVRVIDVFPPVLEQFAHSTWDPSWNNQSVASRQKKERWEWGFVLLLEDAVTPRDREPEKLRVFVNNDAAQHLLKMNAENLEENHCVLQQLEETLFILWGNLMELKIELRNRGSDLPLPPGDNRLQNKPFDACIEEYGAEVAPSEDTPFGYQRMHRLAQTTIQT
ncbi:telomere-binding alpha subunit central domain-containing [Pyrenophora seminiperda CCB06]|uniref:Telomere-binding alpha subunit central domain-containing n=1 Tax=Pyrenophora seminiperda CCB06 TaxID=1302712 RepID=A0A3M7M9A3_9PLEO|nr:telomere-binding alpha subunit central domain-containing [Pyrenophora seminiperda CCB06]